MEDRLFVYGTLRRTPGGRLHPLLEADCTYLCEGYFGGIMYDLGPYPAVVPSDGKDDVVVGELYRMRLPARVLHRLDAYEGKDYERHVRPIALPDGDRMTAWIYLYRRVPDDAVRVISRRSPSGTRGASWRWM